jgi:hypothetical protein
VTVPAARALPSRVRLRLPITDTGAVVAVVFGVVAWCTIRVAIKVKSGKVIVRNLWASGWIDVAEVSRFDAPRC